MKKNILIMSGGGGAEHEISLVSAAHFQTLLQNHPDFDVYDLEIKKNGQRQTKAGEQVELRRAGELYFCDSQKTVKIDYFIPCFHGYPGETGDIQSLYEMMGVPYLGSGAEGSILAFNKVSTKLWLDALGIPNTPWVFLSSLSLEEKKKAQDFFHQHKDIFVKASSQGSSVGCYHVTDQDQLEAALKEAFSLSPFVICEKTIDARELEVAVFEYQNQTHATSPGEIICPSKFYSYEEKYNEKSQTKTQVKAQDIPPELDQRIRQYALKAFAGLKLRHLSRIDFFWNAQSGELYLNEINTFPGMTPISLFPKMVEAHGVNLKDYFCEIIKQQLKP